MKTYPGFLYIISAPSGAGKTSLVNALAKEVSDVRISVSHTTRDPRPGEENSLHYYFINNAEFKKMINDNIFMEQAQVFGNFYGTSRVWVEEQLAAGKDVMLEIDWQGARQVRAQFVDAISIFILPPNAVELRERLLKRHQDNPSVIEERMKEAHNEMVHYMEYDYLVVNDNFEHALDDIKTIVKSQRLRIQGQQQNLSEVLKQLLG